jgi:membrane protein YdbS with pleckstrin-like domain
MKCTGCGVELGTDVTFCPKCGTKVGALPNPDNQGAAAGLTRKGPGPDEPEVKLWSGGYSGKAMVGSWAAGILVTVALIVGCVLLAPGIPVFIGVIALIWVTLAVVLAYRKFSIHYDVTTQRLIHQSGILTRTSDRIELIDIDDVTFTQGIIERMFNVGKIKVSSSDRTHPVLKLIGISDVKRIADLIDDARRKERRKRGVHIENI